MEVVVYSLSQKAKRGRLRKYGTSEIGTLLQAVASSDGTLPAITSQFNNIRGMASGMFLTGLAELGLKESPTGLEGQEIATEEEVGGMLERLCESGDLSRQIVSLDL